MKLRTEKNEVFKSHKFETMNYGVDTSNLPLLFQLLRTNLYSDLHGSIIRELASNVKDAHKEAKKPDAIGEVEWIPSNRLLGVSCELIVRDFGVGLSPERMKNIFGNYLSSTKRGDDDQIGGFGLGSKTPFAYTDSYAVQTVYEGVKYRYLCYIDESQLGAISLLNTELTDEGNGTEIIIPIRNEDEDYALFQEAITTQLGYFTHIQYKGFEMPVPVILFENELCIVKRKPPMTELHVVLGDVAYKIDFKALGLLDTNGNVMPTYQAGGVGLRFKIGELQPTMSRESLFWNDSTKAKVLHRIEKAKASIKAEIEADLERETDYAKWFGYNMTGTTERFPDQFAFSGVSLDTQMDIGGKKLKLLTKSNDWFAGYNIRKVVPINALNGRRGISSGADYATLAPSNEDFGQLPCYQLKRNLNTAACLYLFRDYPSGFLAVSELGEPFDSELKEYHEKTGLWAKSLPDFDEIDVPNDAPNTYDEEKSRRYKELVKNRKLEGKFTAKKMREGWHGTGEFEERFIYNMYEDKFEKILDQTVVYGYQHEHRKMAILAAILTLNKTAKARFQASYGYSNSDKPLMILKIGQQYEKYFFALPNAYHIDEVLSLQTPLTEVLSSIATAFRVKPEIHRYHILSFFGNINATLATKYNALHEFVKEYADKHVWNNDQVADLVKQVFTICKGKLNTAMEADWLAIQEYLDGASLLKCPNFAMYSDEHTHHRQGNPCDGTTVKYLREHVQAEEQAIKTYLAFRGRAIDGSQQLVPGFNELLTVAEVEEPDLVEEPKEDFVITN